MPWKQGESGNPKGRRTRRYEARERELIIEAFPVQERVAAIRRQVKAAVDGDLAALNWLWLRLYGPPPTEVRIGNADDEPMAVELRPVTPDSLVRDTLTEVLRATGQLDDDQAGDVPALPEPEPH